MAHFVLELDTRAPLVEWSAPPWAVANAPITIGYTLDEPELVSVGLTLNGQFLPSTHDPVARTVEAFIPAGGDGGLIEVSALVRDDVDNTATRFLGLSVAGVAPPPPAPSPAVSGGGGGGGSARTSVPVEFVLPGRVRRAREVEFVASGAIAVAVPVEARCAGRASTAVVVELSVPGRRSRAERYLTALREDEELLALL